MRRLTWTLLAIAATTLPAGEARAWDSICNWYADPTQRVELLGPVVPGMRKVCEAINAAHGRWRDPTKNLDEHRVILAKAIELAGLPADLLQTVTIAVPTGGALVDPGHGQPHLPELWPQPLDFVDVIKKLEVRGFTIDELAQLPDFAFSLADWAHGMEECPVEALTTGAPALSDTIQCHQFTTHMGALNSNHFPPQSDRWYQYMHGLALARADQCKAMRKDAWNSFGAFDPALAFDAHWWRFWRDCEIETLAIEAVAQHYLQDSWSSGHMWQRWGSTNLDDFPATTSTDSDGDAVTWNAEPPASRRLMTGEIVAVLSGTIHGSDGPTIEKLGRGINDPACYPTDADIAYVGADGATVAAAGDVHLHDVVGDPWSMAMFGDTAENVHRRYSPPFVNGHTPSADLVTQRDTMFACAAVSVREVYDHLADAATYHWPTFGAPTAQAPMPPPGGCDAPRLSTLAWSRAIDTPMQRWIKFKVARHLAGAILKAVPDDIQGRAFDEYDEARATAVLIAKQRPNTTEMADLAWAPFGYDQRVCADWTPESGCLHWEMVHRDEPAGTVTLLGVERNSVRAPVGNAQPVLADPPLPWGVAGQPLDPNGPEAALAGAFNRAHAPLWCARTTAALLTTLENNTRAAPPASKADRCNVCIETVRRHVRPYPGGKSLCDVLAPNSAAVADTGYDEEIATRRCGCSDQFAAVTDAGLTFVRADGTGAVTTLAGPYAAGTGVTDATTASRNRVFIANTAGPAGAGQIVGYRRNGFPTSSATELDLVANDPATRYPIGGEPRGMAVVDALGKDWLLVADAASDQLKVFDLGTDGAETFTPCRTVDVGRDPARIEGPWDLVVKADGSKAYVSLRGPIGTPGDAIAMLDVPALVDCAGPAPVVTHVTTFGTGRGLGAMALSPDQQYLAVAARRRGGGCLDQVWTTAFGMLTQDVQVPCDEVYVLRVAQLAAGPLSAMAPVTFGARDSLPTRPVSFPYAVAWRPDGAALAYGSLTGFSPWPLYHDFNAQGAIALATMGAAAFPAGAGNLQHWSYNAALPATLRGETIAFTADGQYVLAGATDGSLFTFPAVAGDPFWQVRDGDPETGLHQNANGLDRSWYGGCRVADTGCYGGFCPAYCPAGAAGSVQVSNLGSPIRKLLAL